jgi:hypothetical protein
MSNATPRSRAMFVPAAIAIAALVAQAPPAAAKDAAVGPVARYAESLGVLPGVEHRLLIVHPVLGPAAHDPQAVPVRLGGVSSPDLLAFGRMEKTAKPRAEAVSFAPEATLLLTGDVLRTETADFAVARDTVLPNAKPTQVPLVRISHEVDADAKDAEPAVLGEVMPSALRFLVLSDAPGGAVREAADRWAAEAHMGTPRRSPAELATADLIAKRVADYRKYFPVLPKPAGNGEIVGCAILIDGALASFETFGSGKLFAEAWPKLLEAAATEAAVEEVRDDLLTTDLADPADPDRFLSDLKRRLIDLFGARTRESDVVDEGREYTLSLEGAAAGALVLGTDRVVHFVLVTDPAHRGDKAPGESPDPRAASRKARPTEEEKRLIDRRNGGSAAPVPPEPPPPAPK